MQITANATRDGKWWMVRVPEVDGAMTQCRRVDQVATAARSVVADLLEIDPRSIEVTATHVELPAPRRSTVAAVLARRAEAEAAIKAASAVSAQAVHELRHDGYTTREVAALLGLTPGRVNQIEHKTAA